MASCSLTRGDAEQYLELGLADADVWAYELTVTGTLRGAGKLQDCQVQVVDRSYDAQLTAAEMFRAQVRLDPGVNQVRAQCRTRSGVRLVAPPRQYRVRLPATPTAVARIVSAEGGAELAAAGSGKLILDGSGSAINPSTRRPIVRYEWFRGGAADSQALLGEAQRLEQARPAHEQLYSLRVSDNRGQQDVARVLFRPEGQSSDALRAAVLYGVLPPLYGAPPLGAVTEALPSLAELGVDVLWLAPLFRAPAGDFGYAVTDYFDIRPDYGTSAELRALVTRAHALGLRVLLDLPANHSSDQHPYFVQASRLGRRSHYFDFYARDAAGQPTHYFDWDNLPNLNYANAEVLRFMQEAAGFWLTQYGVDGYRLDAAWGIRTRNPEAWPQLQAALKRTHPMHVLIAEAPARDEYYSPPLFAAAYDWTAELGVHAWKGVFETSPGVAQRLAAALRGAPDNGVRVLRFLNNNDTGPRFITRYGRDMTRLATAALLSLPGLPCLYSFDEVGAAFEPYSKLAPIDTKDPELRSFHQRWIRLRHEQRALSGDGWELLHAGEQDEVLAFLRWDGQARALVVLNFSDKPAQVRLELSAQRWPTRVARELSGASQPRASLQGDVLTLKLRGWDTLLYLPE